MAGAKQCQCCGDQFARPKNISHAQWGARRFCSNRCGAMKRTASDAEVAALYLDGFGSVEIGKKLGLSDVHIRRILRANDVEIRSLSEAMKLSHSREEIIQKLIDGHVGIPCPEHVKQRLREILGRDHPKWKGGLTAKAGYLIFTNSPANGDNAGKRLHRLIAEWKIGRPLQDEEVVHHIDRDTLNNHPNNLMVLANQSEHIKLHAAEDKANRKNAA